MYIVYGLVATNINRQENLENVKQVFWTVPGHQHEIPSFFILDMLPIIPEHGKLNKLHGAQGMMVGQRLGLRREGCHDGGGLWVNECRQTYLCWVLPKGPGIVTIPPMTQGCWTKGTYTFITFVFVFNSGASERKKKKGTLQLCSLHFFWDFQLMLGYGPLWAKLAMLWGLNRAVACSYVIRKAQGSCTWGCSLVSQHASNIKVPWRVSILTNRRNRNSFQTLLTGELRRQACCTWVCVFRPNLKVWGWGVQLLVVIGPWRMLAKAQAAMLQTTITIPIHFQPFTPCKNFKQLQDTLWKSAQKGSMLTNMPFMNAHAPFVRGDNGDHIATWCILRWYLCQLQTHQKTNSSRRKKWRANE